MFYGAGAGSLPTASAVVGDVVDAIRHASAPRGIGWTGEDLPLGDPDKLASRWYVRNGDSWFLTEAMTAAQTPEAEAKYRVLD